MGQLTINAYYLFSTRVNYKTQTTQNLTERSSIMPRSKLLNLTPLFRGADIISGMKNGSIELSNGFERDLLPVSI